MSEDTAKPALSQAATPAPPSTAQAPVADTKTRNLLRVSVVLALVGIAVAMWHFLWPSELAFTAFMTVGQGSFGVAIVVYIWVILRDLRRRRAL